MDNLYGLLKYCNEGCIKNAAQGVCQETIPNTV